MKLFQYRWDGVPSQGWSDASGGLVAVRVSEDGHQFGGLTDLAGAAPPPQVLFEILRDLEEEIPGLRDGFALQMQRKNPVHLEVSRGMSGAVNYRLRILRDARWGDCPTVASMHVSMFAKLNEGVKPMWLGDLAFLVAAAKRDYPRAATPNLAVSRQKTWRAELPYQDGTQLQTELEAEAEVAEAFSRMRNASEEVRRLESALSWALESPGREVENNTSQLKEAAREMVAAYNAVAPEPWEGEFSVSSETGKLTFSPQLPWGLLERDLVVAEVHARLRAEREEEMVSGMTDPGNTQRVFDPDAEEEEV